MIQQLIFFVREDAFKPLRGVPRASGFGMRMGIKPSARGGGSLAWGACAPIGMATAAVPVVAAACMWQAAASLHPTQPVRARQQHPQSSPRARVRVLLLARTANACGYFHCVTLAN